MLNPKRDHHFGRRLNEKPPAWQNFGKAEYFANVVVVPLALIFHMCHSCLYRIEPTVFFSFVFNLSAKAGVKQLKISRQPSLVFRKTIVVTTLMGSATKRIRKKNVMASNITMKEVEM